jgi:pyrimidine operon attenuation protein/uracil phosphoribosyltransferase
MKLMNRSVQRLERQVADASKKDDNLRLINEAQRGCITAKGLVPKGPWSEEPDAAKKAAALAPYRRDLIAVARKLLDLETAIMDDRAEDAASLIKEIKKLKEEGHKEMGVKDD